MKILRSNTYNIIFWSTGPTVHLSISLITFRKCQFVQHKTTKIRQVPQILSKMDKKRVPLELKGGLLKQTLPKAQRTRGLSSTYQSNFLRSYNKFSNIFSNSQILKHFQNLDQAPTSKSQTNISISKKLKLESLDQF